MSLTDQEKRILLKEARRAIETRVQGHDGSVIHLEKFPSALQRPGACFVTLTKGSELRGCVGSIEAKRPLVIEVRKRAVGAAVKDSRFPPLQEDELPGIMIEISCLSPLHSFPSRDARDLLDIIQPGKDGVVLSCGSRKATFLPQVWGKIPSTEEFLARLCLKMGLDGNRWREKGMQVFLYRVDAFQEGQR